MVSTEQRHRFTGLREPVARAMGGNIDTYIPVIYKDRKFVTRMETPQNFV